MQCSAVLCMASVGMRVIGRGSHSRQCGAVHMLGGGSHAWAPQGGLVVCCAVRAVVRGCACLRSRQAAAACGV